MSLDSLLPTFLATEAPNPPKPMALPFKFVGGFGFSTAETGVLMSGQGIYSMLINTFLVPFALGRLGHLRVFQLVAVAYFALYLVTPYLVLLPDNLQMVGICFIIVWKSTFASLAYPSNAMLIADAAPSQRALGTINGVAASTASLCRALAPAVTGMLYAFGLDTGYSGLAWWFSALVTIAGAFLALRIPTQKTYDEKAQGDLEAAPSTS